MIIMSFVYDAETTQPTCPEGYGMQRSQTGQASTSHSRPRSKTISREAVERNMALLSSQIGNV